MFNRLSGINGGRKPNRKKYSSKYCFRLVSDKKYRWLHNLLKMRGIELEPEMIICSQCRIALYRENKRRRSSDMESICNGDDLKNYEDHEYERQQEILPLDNLLILDNIYGNGDDYIYCTWCMKAGVEMKQLSLSERMTLLCEHNLYTSHTARRCTDSCCNLPRKRSHERTHLSSQQAVNLINDLTTELSRVKITPFITDNSTVLSKEDDLSWIGWTLEQLKEMASLVESRMHSSKHRTPFEAMCQFWIKLKTNLSFRQIGTLFKVSTSEESIRRRIEDTFHAITIYLNDVLVSSNLGLNHLTRTEALSHHTTYTKAFFGDQLLLIWDGTYVYCNKSNDHTLQRDCYSGHKSRHLVKLMSLVIPDGYVLDLIGPFYGKHNDAAISRAILDKCTELSVLREDNDTHIVDRDFRDVVEEFQALGYDLKMTGLLSKGDKQLSTIEANGSRLITKCRWVVESFHVRFKKWRFFSERIDQSFLLNLGTLSRIVAASLNRYRPIIYDTKSVEHEDMAQPMLSLLKQQNNIETLVSSVQLLVRKNCIKIFDIRENFDFPHLDLDFLRNYTFVTYQLKMSKPYAKANLFENENELELQMSPDNDQLIRCQLHSRHSGNTRYFICIEFDNNDEDEPIRDHFCQCCELYSTKKKKEARTKQTNIEHIYSTPLSYLFIMLLLTEREKIPYA
ncbi:unnamed protein product [Rotaria magnacalcarata]|uniref:DDE Tnp4 domain-containing protein n=4 Tax=Rotaria magnacalcarata TaxID=392030 RepID=A0A814L8Q2_9BILA|nr:unnamed protein product [Rotaria magnacalcarata]CAF3770293.1 unnamed protein product [Rotaria magnacalcarata]CAF3802273.1 unnamed protein product [Rotaria magnacalcarata]